MTFYVLAQQGSLFCNSARLSSKLLCCVTLKAGNMSYRNSLSWLNNSCTRRSVNFNVSCRNSRAITFHFNNFSFSVSLCPQIPYCGNDMIFWFFSIVPFTRVLHLRLANWQGFGWEFHLRSSPCAFSGYMDDQSTSWLLHNLPHHADETQQGQNSCPQSQFLALSLDSTKLLPC